MFIFQLVMVGHLVPGSSMSLLYSKRRFYFSLVLGFGGLIVSLNE